MTREEAAQWLINLKSEYDGKTWSKWAFEVFDMAIAALRGPDPDTGLVPCGCGGKAETHELFGEYNGTYMTDCKECGTGTTQYSTKKESQDAWNTAMGRAKK